MDWYSSNITEQFLSPLQEIPLFGRNPVYMITLGIFAVLQIPTALSPNIGSLLVLRALSGFFASPALATGGASLGDMYVPLWLTHSQIRALY
jgi:MFS transporter, DHA1 family, multidrug resistance protein